MSSIKSDSSEEAISIADQELVVQKWSILWRTIILSALGRTILPYCKYIKVLDLDDLRQLLEDDRFRAKISRYICANQSNFLLCDYADMHKQLLLEAAQEIRPHSDRTREETQGERSAA